MDEEWQKELRIRHREMFAAYSNRPLPEPKPVPQKERDEKPAR